VFCGVCAIFIQSNLSKSLENCPYEDIINEDIFIKYCSDYRYLHSTHKTIYNELLTNKAHFEKLGEFLKAAFQEV
jgi:hypothetical protein